jgi:hypothetical protein
MNFFPMLWLLKINRLLNNIEKKSHKIIQAEDEINLPNS